MSRHFIVKIESFEGRDAYLQCGNNKQDYLFCIISIDDRGSTEIIDNGYRSFGEAANAWPEAANAHNGAAC
jgi:hypothetical protein